MNPQIDSQRWKRIEGCLGYWISDEGNLSVEWTRRHTQKGSIRVPSEHPVPVPQMTNPRGYRYVRLRTDDETYKNFQVHRLVLAAFVGPCPLGHEGCHRDGSRTNSRLENLYWGTRAENCRDAVDHGRNPWSTISADQREAVVRLRNEGMRQVDIAAKVGIPQPSVSRILIKLGRRTQAARSGRATE